MNDSKYLIKHTVPEVAEYLTLRKACGLSLRGTAASKIGLSNSLFCSDCSKNQRSNLSRHGPIDW